MSEIKNLRIHFYGVQGSGSIFPSREERETIRKYSDIHLLKEVFNDLKKHSNKEGDIEASIEEVIGGPLNDLTLENYRNSLKLLEQRIYGGWTTCCRRSPRPTKKTSS